MDPDQDLEPDLYRDPDRFNSRPVPPPRRRSSSGADSGLKPRLGPDAVSEAKTDPNSETEELRGKQLFNKWRSLEKKPDPEPGLGSRTKSRSWTRPGLKDFRQTDIRSTEETQSGSGPISEPDLKKQSSLPRNIDFRGLPQTRPGPEPVPTPRPRQKLLSQTSSEASLDSQPQSLKSYLDFRGSEPELEPFQGRKSKQHDIDFKELQPRSGPELEPFQSGGSKHHNIDFKGLPQTRLEPDWQSHLDPIFQKLELQMVEFVKQQLQKFQKLLTSESSSQSASEEQDSELVLNLTLDFLRRMDQEPLADLLLTKSSGSVCQGKLKSRLQQRFSQVFEGVAKAGDSAPLNQIYTEINVAEGEASETNLEHEIRHIESVSRKPADPETAITFKDIFKPRAAHRKGPIAGEQKEKRPIRTVLTKGVAGVGKTVLTQKFCLDWAEGRANQDIQLLFPFTFRELNVLRDREYSLVELLQHFFSEITGVCSIKNLQVLFIFDGLDECRLSLDFKKAKVVTEPTERVSVEELLVNLIRGSLLPSAHVWITTRPAAANQIPAECVSMVTEVRGFTNSQKEQYFRKRFTNQQQATAIISHIKKSRILYSMCYIPIFCWILCAVLQKILEQTEKPQLPQTLTEMYVHFLVVQAKVTNIKFHEGSGTDLHWIPKTVEMVQSLGRLAFEQLQKGNLIFYESDLRECGLDAAEIARYSGVFTEVFKEEPGLYQDKVYCFIHLTVQEFLAALHVHQTFYSSGDNLLVDDAFCLPTKEPAQFYKSAVEMCLRYKHGQLDLFLRFLLGLSIPANQSLLRGLMSQTGSERTNQETVRYVQMKLSEELSTDRALNLFHCLNELQDCSLEQQMQNLLRSGVLDPSRLSSGQWATLVFLLLSSDRDLEQFDLRKFCPSENALQRLLPVLEACSKALLSGCHLTERCCPDLGSVLAGSDLKELDLSNNDLRDSGVEQLCEGLKSATCGLQTLRLSICNLTARCCSALGSVLAGSDLKELDLSNNDLRDSGVEQLCKGIKSATCGLQTLRLSGCLLTQVGCFSLNTALSENPSHLQELDLSYNNPGPYGVQLLTALRDDHNNRLTTLKVDFWEHWGMIMIPGLAKYSCEPTLDSITANSELKVQQGNRLVMFTEESQDYPQHPQRFDWYPQVLCTLKNDEPGLDPGPRAQTSPYLSGRSYWEVDWSGGVAIAVTDTKIRRRGDHRNCVFGFNDHSWRLWCSEGRYAVCHDSKQQVLSVVPPGAEGRVGVFLDSHSGTLSFYEVRADPSGQGDHRTHLHTFNASFPQNLLPAIGFGLRSYESTAYLCGVYYVVGNEGLAEYPV